MIDLLPSEEQQALIDSVVDFLSGELPVERLRHFTSADGLPEHARWRELATMGWFGLAIPEAQGGLGLGAAEEMLLLRECGRYLVTPAVAATQLAAHIAFTVRQTRLLERFVAGDLRAGFAGPGLTLTAEGGLTGQCFLIDAQAADYVVVRAPASAGNSACSAPRLGLMPVSAFRRSLPAPGVDASITIERANVEQRDALAGGIWPESDCSGLIARADLHGAAQLLGMAEAHRDMAADYAKLRKQFGKLIGSFQAVAHQCADMAVRAEASNAQCALAALMLDARQPQTDLEIAAALWIAHDAAQRNALSNIQVHGGIGYTADCNAHFYLKRVRVIQTLCTRRTGLVDTLLGRAVCVPSGRIAQALA